MDADAVGLELIAAEVDRVDVNQSSVTDSTGHRRLLRPSEVARTFRVQTKTVTRWADEGKLTCIRTVGGHRRFDAEEIRRLLSDTEEP
jgi:excisionase family DNA binding protein